MTIWPVKATAESMPAEALQGGGDQASAADSGRAEVAHLGHDLDRGAGGLELVDQLVGRVAEHEVVAPRGQEAGQGRADVVAGVGDEGDASGFGHAGAPGVGGRSARAGR